MYWRLKIKPGFQITPRDDDDPAPATGHWEVRREPNRVSITLFREPRHLSDPEAGDPETETQGQRRRKSGNNPTRCEQAIANTAPEQVVSAKTAPAHTQLGAAGPSTLYLVPPPPPRVVWDPAAISLTTMPPPPPLGPPTVLPPGLSTAPLGPSPLGVSTVPGSCPPDASPPYMGRPAPQNVQDQAPRQGTAASPIGRRNSNGEMTQQTPVQENRSQWRRWFSLGGRLPTVGHASTLSDFESSSTAAPRRSLSPPPPSVSPSRPNRGPGRSRHPSSELPRPSSAGYYPTARSSQSPWQNIQGGTQRRYHNDLVAHTESTVSSSYINTSLEAVFHNQEPRARSRRHDRASRSRERRSGWNGVRRTRLASPESVPLDDLSHRRTRRPSPDLQFPSPERGRARVSFTLPRGSDDGSTSTSQNWEGGRRSSARAQHSPRGSHGETDRRRSQGSAERKQSGLTSRVSETLYRMRRALRGKD